MTGKKPGSLVKQGPARAAAPSHRHPDPKQPGQGHLLCALLQRVPQSLSCPDSVQLTRTPPNSRNSSPGAVEPPPTAPGSVGRFGTSCMNLDGGEDDIFIFTHF